MEKILHHTKQVIFNKQKDILGSTLILSAMIVLSRIFGIFRYRILTHYFSTQELDIFIASFRIPDFLFEVLITGALSAAFIPIFIKYQKSQEELEDTISSVINLIFLSLFILIFIVFIGADLIVPLMAPGFASDAEKIKHIVYFSRVLLVSQLPLLVAGYILSGMAQANKIFVITAIAPVLYNIGIIIATIALASNLWIFGPVIGVIIGAFLFFIVQTPVILILNFRYKPVFNRKVLHEFVSLFLPRLFTVVATQIDLTIDLVLSSLLGAGSYTIFFFSQHLQFFPVSFFGMSLAQASLPYFSDLYKQKRMVEFKKIFVDSILQMFFFTIPISAYLIFARTPIVRIFFGGKRFEFGDTNLTAVTLSYFALSIPFHTIFYFVTRSYYAMHDTRRPFFINTFSIIVNVALSVFFISVLHLQVWSLALAFSISITCNVVVSMLVLYWKLDGYNVRKLIKNTVKILMATSISSAIAYPLMRLLDGLILDTTRTINVFMLLFLTFSVFTAVYLFICWLVTIEEVYIIGKLLLKAKEMKKKLTEVYADVG